MITTTNSTITFRPVATYASANDETATLALLIADHDAIDGRIQGKLLFNVNFSAPHHDLLDASSELVDELFNNWNDDDAPDSERRLRCVNPVMKKFHAIPQSPCQYMIWIEYVGSPIPPEPEPEDDDQDDYASWVETVYEVSGSGWRD